MVTVQSIQSHLSSNSVHFLQSPSLYPPQYRLFLTNYPSQGDRRERTIHFMNLWRTFSTFACLAWACCGGFPQLNLTAEAEIRRAPAMQAANSQAALPALAEAKYQAPQPLLKSPVGIAHFSIAQRPIWSRSESKLRQRDASATRSQTLHAQHVLWQI